MPHAWLMGLTLAAASTGAADSSGGGMSLLSSAVPFILIFAVLYFLIIRPQQKTAKQQQTFVSQLKKGDEVLLQSGLFGKVAEVADGFLSIELSPNVKVKVLKNAVTGPSPLSRQDGEKK